MVLEGLMPALSPRGYRKAVEQIGGLPDAAIRRFGIVLIVAGAFIFHLAR